MTEGRRAPLVLLPAAALFLAVNRAAYHGWFQHDDFAHLSWTSQAGWTAFVAGLLSPRFYANNFRPVGHAWYALMGRAAGLEYGWYLACMHLFHLLAAGLLWLLLRRLGTKPWAAAAGTVFFLYHWALYDIYWHPAYVFDLLCAVFSLASLLCYTARRYIPSFVFFWLAYKSKEPGVMLPAVLACYEWWWGGRSWRRVAPFLAASLSFGLQGILLNPARNDDYAFRFGPAALGTTARFYLGQFAGAWWAGLALLAAALAAVRDRRVYFGAAAAVLMLAPMLALPLRARGVYLYESMIGAAVVFAAVAERGAAGALPGRFRPALAAGFLAVWMPWNYTHLPAYRRGALAEADENRAYVTALAADARRFPSAERFLWESAPGELPDWAIEGAIRFVYHRHDPDVRYLRSFATRREAWEWPGAALLNWDPGVRRLFVLRRGPAPVAYVEMRGEAPPWPLEQGWGPLGPGLRWTRGRASATLWRPARARAFEVRVNVGPDQFARRGGVAVAPWVGGRELSAKTFRRDGHYRARWELPEAPSGPVPVEIRIPPEYQLPGNDGELGAAVMGLGFVDGQ